MTRVKEAVKAHLEQATAWLSTNDVVIQLGLKHSSAGRALRYLWEDNFATKTKIPGDRYGRMQWVASSKYLDPSCVLTPVTPPTQTVYAKKTKHSPIIRNKPAVTGTISVTTTNQGALIMQIEQGVDTVVAELVKDEKTFSAHDVTVELRKRVNDGSIQVDPGLAGTAHVGGKDVTKIEHGFVNAAVRQLMASNRFPDYVKEHNPAGFNEYKPIAKSTGSAPSTDPATPPAASGSAYDGNSSL